MDALASRKILGSPETPRSLLPRRLNRLSVRARPTNLRSPARARAIGVLVKKVSHYRLHPSWERGDPLAQIIANRLPMLPIVQDGGESGDDTIAIRRQRVLEPMQRLHDTHRRTSGPVQLAGGRVLEVDLEFVELNRPASSIGVDHNV